MWVYIGIKVFNCSDVTFSSASPGAADYNYRKNAGCPVGQHRLKKDRKQVSKLVAQLAAPKCEALTIPARVWMRKLKPNWFAWEPDVKGEKAQWRVHLSHFHSRAPVTLSSTYCRYRKPVQLEWTFEWDVFSAGKVLVLDLTCHCTRSSVSATRREGYELPSTTWSRL